MLARNLLNATKIAGIISNTSSLTPLYRSIELSQNSLRCCSEYGNLELTLAEDTGLIEPCLIDAKSITDVPNTLPGDAELELSAEDNRLSWKCGQAKGHLNFVHSDHKIPKLAHESFPWTPPDTLPNALLLASSACTAAAVTYGLYGICIEPDGDKLRLTSSNSISLASALIEKGNFPGEKITLRPPVPRVIATLMQNCTTFAIDITKQGIFVKGDWLTAHLPLGVNLEHDLKALLDQRTKAEHTAKINGNAVKKFITRAKLLADKHANFNVSVKVEEGKLILQHAGISSALEEFFLADGLDTSLTKPPVFLGGDLLAMPLQYVDTVIFDYIDESELILKGESFIYIIGAG